MLCVNLLRWMTSWRLFILSFIVAGLSLHVVADGRQFFEYTLIEDFSQDANRGRVTSEAQNEMAQRRRGTFVSDLGEHAGRVGSQLGKEVRRFFIDIAEDNRAKLIFECADGEYVSSRVLFTGQMSDQSFCWGSSVDGMVARYGVLGDYLPIAFCRRERLVTFVMKRSNVKLDLGKVRFVPFLIRMDEENNQSKDIFSLVCETEPDGRICRLNATNEFISKRAGDAIVAYYIGEKNRFYEGLGLDATGKTSLPFLYWVLKASGEFILIEGDGKDKFRKCPLFDLPWWDELGKLDKGPNGVYSMFFDIRRDEIVVTFLPFSYSRSLDFRIKAPRFFETKVPRYGQKTRGQILDGILGRLYENPNSMFEKVWYRRIKNTDENKELREKLANAVAL